MTDAPPRRWYQFKLSTILVLVGIVAWAMAYFLKGYFITPWFRYETPEPVKPRNYDDWSFTCTLGTPDGEAIDCLLGFVFRRGIGWPLLALAAFLTWKLVWVIGARRNRNRKAACTQS